MEFNMIEVIAFDVFGTVFNLDAIPRQEIKDYVYHIRQPEWRPLTLPSSWEYMPIHPDSIEGVRRLRNKFKVVTCSNGPVKMLRALSRNAGIEWDCFIPLEDNHVYKPDLRAYGTICETMGVDPSQVLMVTANETSGDLGAPLKIGMQTMEIRGETGPQNIIELAELFGC
jgi:2-haloacid dehalogenase